MAAPDNLELAERHLRCAVAEAPLLRSDAVRDFPVRAVERVTDAAAAPRVMARERRLLSRDGTSSQDVELSLSAPPAERGSTVASSAATGKLLDRADGEVILSTDAVRIASVAYPGRVFVVDGRRYRVLMPDEQTDIGGGVLLAEPERRRLLTSRVRSIELALPGRGNELHLGAGASVRFHQPKVALKETVFGVRIAHEARARADELGYEAPIEVSYQTRVAALHLDGASDAALHALAHLTRAALPAFVRHGEEDLDVGWQGGDDPALLVVDRHPGEVGFARAVSSEVVRHVLYWAREIALGCDCEDGCPRCVRGTCLSPRGATTPSRRGVLALLDQVLGSRST